MALTAATAGRNIQMTTVSRIEWTERTWNPTVGCTKISPGCKHCYAEAMSYRLKAMGTAGYENGFALTLLPSRLQDPIERKSPPFTSSTPCRICFTTRCQTNTLSASFKSLSKHRSTPTKSSPNALPAWPASSKSAVCLVTHGWVSR